MERTANIFTPIQRTARVSVPQKASGSTADNLPRAALKAIGWSVPLWLFASVWDSEVICILAALVGGSLAVQWFWKLLAKPYYITHMLPLGGVALTAIFNLGFLTAWASTRLGMDQDFSQTFGQIGLSFSQYSIAIFYATLFSLALAGCGTLTVIRNAENFLAIRLLQIRRMNTFPLVLLLLVCMSLNAFVVLSGLYTYRTINTEGAAQGHVAWFLPFLDAVFAMQIVGNALLIYKCIVGRRTRWLGLALAGMSAASVLFVCFNKGRSDFMLALSLHFFYWCLFSGRRPRVIVLAVLAVFVYFVVPKVLIVNNFMRTSAFTGNSHKLMALTSATLAFEQLDSNAGVVEEARKRALDNFTTRPLVAQPLAKSIALNPAIKEYMLGTNLLVSLAWVVPRVIFDGKKYLPAQEGLLFRYFPDRIFLQDTSDSIYLYSYADFGWLGIILYPLMILMLWSIALFLQVRLNSAVSIWALFALWPPLFMLQIGEGSVTAWFVTLRNTLMFWLIAKIMELLFNVKRPVSSPVLPAHAHTLPRRS